MPDRLTAAAHCLRCDQTWAGDPETVDRAAEKHVRAGHPTATAITPQSPKETG